MKTSNGSIYAKSWKFPFLCDDQNVELTMHFYNKPKSKPKQSKILVQGRSQYALYRYVFTDLPKIYKTVSQNFIPSLEVTPTFNNSVVKSAKVACVKCKKSFSVSYLKIHMRKAHFKRPTVKQPKIRVQSRTQLSLTNNIMNEVISSDEISDNDDDVTLEEVLVDNKDKTGKNKAITIVIDKADKDKIDYKDKIEDKDKNDKKDKIPDKSSPEDKINDKVDTNEKTDKGDTVNKNKTDNEQVPGQSKKGISPTFIQKCKHCDEPFENKTLLSNHIGSWHQSLFLCDFCEESFQNSDDQIKH